ncbi:MAG: hypothetical protein ABI622_10535 [Chloroflexota bacterium]
MTPGISGVEGDSAFKMLARPEGSERALPTFVVEGVEELMALDRCHLRFERILTVHPPVIGAGSQGGRHGNGAYRDAATIRPQGVRPGAHGVSAADGIRRVPPLKCLNWMVGHLENREHRFWVRLAQQRDLAPGLNDGVGYGKPASEPALDETSAAWRMVTAASDTYLGTLTPRMMETALVRGGKPGHESIAERRT